MTFSEELYDWIDDALRPVTNPEKLGFCFNLREPYGIEIIGSDAFDENDVDWPCEETYVPSPKDIDIPAEVCSGTWEECLALVKDLVQKYLKCKRDGADKLIKSKGVGIGFVDGDLELLYVNRKM